MIVLVLKMLEKLTGAYTKDPDSLIGKLFQLFASALWDVEDTLQVIAVWRGIDNAKGTTWAAWAGTSASGGTEPMTASIA